MKRYVEMKKNMLGIVRMRLGVNYMCNSKPVRH